MKKIYVAVVVFSDDQGRVLMHHRAGDVRKFGEEWAFLGGGIEEGENPLLAAKREIAEEVGYQLDDARDQLVPFKNYDEMFNEETEGEIHVYKAKFPGLDLFQDSEEVKVEDLKLFSIEDAKKLKTFPVAYRILKDLED